MTYKITLSKKFLKQLKKLEKPTRERIINALEKIKFRPYDFIIKLVGKPFYKLRVGRHYRVLIEIIDKEIKAHKVGPRRNIYDR